MTPNLSSVPFGYARQPLRSCASQKYCPIAYLGGLGKPVQQRGCRRLKKHNVLSVSVIYSARKPSRSGSPVYGLPSDQQPIVKAASQRNFEDPEEDPESWGFLDWETYTEKWQVPWGGPSLALGMGAWLVSSVLLGVAVIPQALRAAGANSFSMLSAQQQSFILLEAQVIETIVGLGIIFLAVRPFMPFPDDIFKYSLESPCKKPRGWAVWAFVGLIGCIAVNVGIASLVSISGIQEPSGPGTVTAVAGIVQPDLATYLNLLAVVGVLAPALEETVFRGFLLTSLTKYMPTPLAVLFSSLAFGLAHLAPKDFPYLTAVGIVWGFVYVRSRNLLTPMLMHSIWNSSVITILFVLAASGIDIKELV